ncbi:MAG: 2-C-methyl-D-erythritol 4-phosphate cytidylyltransferase [Rhizobacter sp.]|nr:2-C-methyl-D-erythritol 4-phosphate cytidylyltransferase [Rhizobacter sp.]
MPLADAPHANDAPAVPDSAARLYALVPCAGVGERSGADGPKQYATLMGQSLVAHTLEAVAQEQRLSATLVVLRAQDAQFEHHAPAFMGWSARVGGATRAQTVANGLDELVRRGAAPQDWVLVHDAARCLVRPEWIDALIDACLADAVGGLLALPVADTLKAEGEGAQLGRVQATIARHARWQAQTPQMFRLQALRDALAAAGANVTDEASAIEAQGLSPRLVQGALENFKVTYPADFDLAERLLRTRG